MNYFEQLKKESEPGSRPPQPPRASRPVKRVVQDIAPPAREPLRVAPRPSPRPKAVREPEAQPAPAATAASEIAVRTWEPAAIRRGRLRRRVAAAGIGVFVLAGTILPTAVFPRFSVTINPKLERVPVSAVEFAALTALVKPVALERRLPAIEVTAIKSITREFESSGVKFVQERARGTVILYNAYSSAPQTLIAGTRLQDPSGKIFRLQRGVTVPGARVSEGKIVPTSITTEVIANEVGTGSNIGPAEFRIPGFRGTPKYQGFYAKSEEPLTGGFSGEARIVEAGDLARASEELTREAIAALEQELGVKVPDDPDFLSPDGARELLITDVAQPKAGERYDRFPVTVSARGRVFAIRRSDLGQSLGSLLLPAADGFAVRVAPEQPDLAVRSVRLGTGEMRLSVSGELAYWREGDRTAIASVLHASTPAKAEAYLRGREEIGSFRVRRFPFWLWFIPDRAGGLEIGFQQPE